MVTSLAERELINAGQEHSVMACAFNIAKILLYVEMVGDRKAVVYFSCKRTRGVTLVIRHVIGEGVVCVEVKPPLHAVRCIQFECTVVGFTRIEGAEKLRPV